MTSSDLIIDVVDGRIREITQWFYDQGLDEAVVIENQGWMLNRVYRMQFRPEYCDLAVLFKLALGGS